MSAMSDLAIAEANAAAEVPPQALVSASPPFDAVAYNPGTRCEAYELCKRLPEELRQERRMRYGLRRGVLENGQNDFAPGCDRWITPALYGSGALTPNDFAWTFIRDGIWGGTLSDTAREKIRAAARAEAAAALAQREADETQRRAQLAGAILVWQRARSRALREYCLAVAHLAGVKNPERLGNETLTTLADVADVPVKISLEEFLAETGSAPAPEDFSGQLPGIEPGDMADFENLCDSVVASVVLPRRERETLKHRPRR